MNENNEEIVTPTEAASPEAVAEAGVATNTDNNAPVPVVCGISGVEIKEGDEVVSQVVEPTEAEAAEGRTSYNRIVLLSSLSEDERAALPEGSVKTFPQLN